MDKLRLSTGQSVNNKNTDKKGSAKDPKRNVKHDGKARSPSRKHKEKKHKPKSLGESPVEDISFSELVRQSEKENESKYTMAEDSDLENELAYYQSLDEKENEGIGNFIISEQDRRAKGEAMKPPVDMRKVEKKFKASRKTLQEASKLRESQPHVARLIYRKLANEGDTAARMHYAQMLETGEGGYMDKYEAKFYYGLAMTDFQKDPSLEGFDGLGKQVAEGLERLRNLPPKPRS